MTPKQPLTPNVSPSGGKTEDPAAADGQRGVRSSTEAPALAGDRPGDDGGGDRTRFDASQVASRSTRGRVQRRQLEIISEKIIEALIYLCGISAIVFVFSIFFFVFREGAPFLAKLKIGEFLFSTQWFPTSQTNPKFGVGALIVGTMSVTALAIAIAVPFGLGAAVFVSEFCTGKVKETLKVVVELLAAIPSVVWGFVGLSVMSPIIINTFHVPIGVNMFNGALLLALMSVPLMVSIGEDSLKAVPDSYREAGIALGCTRWQLVYRVLFPAAKNGLLAAVLLGVGRAIGETMAVLMATGHSVRIPHSIFDPVRTLTATIAAELGETSKGSDHYQVLFLIGILLFIITFIVNLAADMAVKGIRKK
jgi:phosphate transport system permease protein